MGYMRGDRVMESTYDRELRLLKEEYERVRNCNEVLGKLLSPNKNSVFKVEFSDNELITLEKRIKELTDEQL